MTQRISTVTRMPFGVTNASPRQTMANYGCPDPMWSAYVDLEYIQNGDITALSQNGGATLALVAGVGGLATVTTGAVANTFGSSATNQAVFQIPQTGNAQGRMFFKWAGSIDSLAWHSTSRLRGISRFQPARHLHPIDRHHGRSVVDYQERFRHHHGSVPGEFGTGCGYAG